LETDCIVTAKNERISDVKLMKNTSFTTKSLLSQLNKPNENLSKLLCLR